MVASPYGGVNIEEIARTSPSYIYKDAVDITSGGDIHMCPHAIDHCPYYSRNIVQVCINEC